MNTLAVQNVSWEKLSFPQRVDSLREKIGWMRLWRRRSLSEKEVVNVREMTRDKVANIIEFTLLELGAEVNRELIRRIVEEQIDTIPIIKKAQEWVLSIQDSEREFVEFLEWRRVRNPEVRLWISGLVNLAMKSEQNP
jgi:hypothetical protein